MRSQLAVLLATFCAAATAPAQHDAVARTGRGTTDGFHPGASLPLVNSSPNPYLISDLTFAQRLGAVVAGSANGLPSFWGPASFGAAFFPGQYGLSGFGVRNSFPWFCPRRNNALGFAGSGLSPVAYPAFAYGPSVPDYYPTAQSNDTVVPLPQYLPEFAPPLTISPMRSSQAPNRQVEPREFITDHPYDFSPNDYGIRIYQAPERASIPEGDHPALVALKNGCAYTVTAYWVKGKSINFITTHGNHIHLPLEMLDRLYPRYKHESSESTSHSR